MSLVIKLSQNLNIRLKKTYPWYQKKWKRKTFVNYRNKKFKQNKTNISIDLYLVR